MCRPCLERESTLDFSRSVDEYGPAAGTAPAIVFAHGGGGCRLMYAHQARALASRGYRCVLLDLPAHGALLDVPLSIATACTRIAAVAQEYAPPYAGVAPAFVGGSLGGYIGMELLGREPDLFSCAVISCATQTVGVGAGCAARSALSAMSVALGIMYGETVVRQMIGVVGKRTELMQEALQEAVWGPSMFFQHGRQHVAVLKASNPLQSLELYHGPVLFADGSEDHHDNRDRLVQASKANNAASRAVVYEVRGVAAVVHARVRACVGAVDKAQPAVHVAVPVS